MKKSVTDFIFLKDKKGISAIIVTLLMIVLSLVAVGAVWVVISNVLSSGTEQTSSAFGQITLSMKIESVKTDSNGDVLVAVKRNAGAGDLSGINLIVSDGTNSQIIKKDESISELATKTFTITSAELTDVAFVKEIQIAPISKDSSGKETIGNAVDNEEFAGSNIIQIVPKFANLLEEMDSNDMASKLGSPSNPNNQLNCQNANNIFSCTVTAPGPFHDPFFNPTFSVNPSTHSKFAVRYRTVSGFSSTGTYDARVQNTGATVGVTFALNPDGEWHTTLVNDLSSIGSTEIGLRIDFPDLNNAEGQKFDIAYMAFGS